MALPAAALSMLAAAAGAVAQDLGAPPAGSPDPAAGPDPRPEPATVPTINERAITGAVAADPRAQPGAPPAAVPGAPPAGAAQGAVRAPTTGALNPDLSVIVDGAFGYYGRDKADFDGVGIPPSGDDPAPDKEGFTLQEVELAFQAPIDPYLEGAVFLTIPNLEGVEVEEAYLLTTALPANLQVKAGSFRSQVGRNNGQHLHLQHMTRRPLLTPWFFGLDGLRGPGLQVSVLLPGLPWFATLYGEALSPPPPEAGACCAGYAPWGGGGRRTLGRLTYAATLEQSWDLGTSLTALLGLGAVHGEAATLADVDVGQPAWLWAADLFLKWRPPTALGDRTSVSLTAEYAMHDFAAVDEPGAELPADREGAFYAEVVVQVARRLFLGGRLDVTGVPSGRVVRRRIGEAGSFTFAPTEFSRVRLYYQHLGGREASGDVPDAHIGFLQAEISMGAHGAHPF